MAINFAAASTAGLNNPGTEIITLVKDGNGNFINPPSYDKMLAYLRSGDVPCLFVTDEAGTTGDIYQLSGYSETENKIRFTGEKTAIEFSEGSDVPSETEIGGGGAEITDGIVVKARDADGYPTQVDFYGDAVYPWTFGAGNDNGANTTNFSLRHVAVVNLKNTVTKLKDYAFAGATELVTVNGLNLDEITEAGKTPFKFSFNWHFSAVLTKNIQISFANCGITSIEAREWTQVLNNCFSGCNALVSAKFPKATTIGTYTANCFKSCTALETAEFGSIGHGVTGIRPDVFSNCTQSFLTITVYTTGANADPLLANIRNGATNATIIIKASEDTTYSGTAYTAGNTMITSEVA